MTKKTHNSKGELRRELGFPQLDFFFLILTDSCNLALPISYIYMYMHIFISQWQQKSEFAPWYLSCSIKYTLAQVIICRCSSCTSKFSFQTLKQKVIKKKNTLMGQPLISTAKFNFQPSYAIFFHICFLIISTYTF